MNHLRPTRRKVQTLRLIKLTSHESTKTRAGAHKTNQRSKRGKREREPVRQEKVALMSGTTDRGAKLKGKLRWSQKRSGNSTSERKEFVTSDDPNFQPKNYMFEGEGNTEQQLIQQVESKRKAIQPAKQPKTKRTNINRDKPKGKTQNKRDSRITNNNFTGPLIGAISIEPYVGRRHSEEPIKKEKLTPYPGEIGAATQHSHGVRGGQLRI